MPVDPWRCGVVALALLVSAPGPARGAAGPLRVVATTTLVASVAADGGRGRAEVSSLLPVGASPETYEPSPTDVVRLTGAGLIVENGAGLEAWLAAMVRASGTRARIVTCSDGLPVTAANPHLWLDPIYARHYVQAMRDGMIAADPAGAATYRVNAAALDARLVQLTDRIRARIATIPPANRNMIVFHNAWLYYDRRFGLTTLGEIEDVPGSEPSAEHLARLVDAARGAHVRAIFAEPEYNRKLVDAVARSAVIPQVAILYDDSVGTSPATRDYVSMLDTDTAAIVAGLR